MKAPLYVRFGDWLNDHSDGVNKTINAIGNIAVICIFIYTYFFTPLFSIDPLLGMTVFLFGGMCIMIFHFIIVSILKIIVSLSCRWHFNKRWG